MSELDQKQEKHPIVLQRYMRRRYPVREYGELRGTFTCLVQRQPWYKSNREWQIFQEAEIMELVEFKLEQLFNTDAFKHIVRDLEHYSMKSHPVWKGKIVHSEKWNGHVIQWEFMENDLAQCDEGMQNSFAKSVPVLHSIEMLLPNYLMFQNPTPTNAIFPSISLPTFEFEVALLCKTDRSLEYRDLYS